MSPERISPRKLCLSMGRGIQTKWSMGRGQRDWPFYFSVLATRGCCLSSKQSYFARQKTDLAAHATTRWTGFAQKVQNPTNGSWGIVQSDLHLGAAET